MILSQLLTLGSLLIWLLAAGLSVMAFDSGESAAAWSLVIVVWAYPIIPLALVIGAWIAFAKRKKKSPQFSQAYPSHRHFCFTSLSGSPA